MRMETAALTPTRLRECLHEIGWTQRALAEQLGIDDRTVRLQWIMGKKPIPPEIASWLEGISAAHRRKPPGWPRPLQHGDTRRGQHVSDVECGGGPGRPRATPPEQDGG